MSVNLTTDKSTKLTTISYTTNCPYLKVDQCRRIQIEEKIMKRYLLTLVQ